MPLAVQIGHQFYAIHTDHLNTLRRLTDANGNPVWQWAITAFGELEPTTTQTGWIRERLGSAGPISNTAPVTFNLRYPGQQFDSETGLFYNHHRTYDPYLTVGYTEADPIGLAGGWNRFGYVNGNPINLTDPSGLDPWWREPQPFPGPNACSYYKSRCEESCGADKYACEAQKCCESFGDNRGSNCTRKCLIDEDIRLCSHLEGPGRDRCRKNAHIGCYTVCSNVIDAINGRLGFRPPPACMSTAATIGGMW